VSDDAQQAVRFHDATKYYSLRETHPGDERIGIGDPAMRTEAIWQKDWDIKPLLYKVYETLPPIELARDLPDAGRPALEAIAATGAEASGVVPDRTLLGRLGLLTNGQLDRTWTTRDGRVHHYRTAGGTGAQYHLELYFVCTDLADLDAGVYHYCAIDHSLRLLRRGDFRAALVDATGNEPSIAAAPVVLVAGVGSGAQHHPAQELAGHQVDQLQRHGQIMPGTPSRGFGRSTGVSRVSGTHSPVRHGNVGRPAAR
jgi:hypothetical protein